MEQPAPERSTQNNSRSSRNNNSRGNRSRNQRGRGSNSRGSHRNNVYSNNTDTDGTRTANMSQLGQYRSTRPNQSQGNGSGRYNNSIPSESYQQGFVPSYRPSFNYQQSSYNNSSNHSNEFDNHHLIYGNEVSYPFNGNASAPNVSHRQANTRDVTNAYQDYSNQRGSHGYNHGRSISRHSSSNNQRNRPAGTTDHQNDSGAQTPNSFDGFENKNSQLLPRGTGKDGQDEKEKRCHDSQDAEKTLKAISTLKIQELVESNENELSLKDRITDQLSSGRYECLVCCENIRQTTPIWGCNKCYHCFHLYCIKKWAQCENSSVTEGGWRCPGCQDIIANVPNRYMCFCGKKRSPWWNRRDTPHTCGEICNKPLKGVTCPHFCVEKCHPGPCESCTLTVKMKCECGNSHQVVRCGQKNYVTCSDTCNKVLNCGLHRCDQLCHTGPCEECPIVIGQSCFCGSDSREVICTTATVNIDKYSCSSICNQVLSCGSHKCDKVCHDGECTSCFLLPSVVENCPCGKKKLIDIYEEKDLEPRSSCTSPIPSCGGQCHKVLKCGTRDGQHLCKHECHEGSCPSCPLISSIRCKCNFQEKEIACSEIGDCQAKCNKRCNKKMSCRRHKCLATCCTLTEHSCNLICDRRLSCRLHNCIEPCHSGACQTCWLVSFDELRCLCGASVIYPPVACGTKPPECNEMCSRVHSCSHPVQHNCHSDDQCPPCTFLTQKWCYGEHEVRNCVPCYLEYVSCGKPCGKLLLCGTHKCNKVCHSENCDDQCKQICAKPRDDCGHPCGAVCHPGSDCPTLPCKHKVTISCECGRRKETVNCVYFSKSQISEIVAKMNDVRQGKSVNLKTLGSKERKLDCDTECMIMKRNRQLALALQIENPDVSSKLNPPLYSDWLKDQARNSVAFFGDVLDKLTKLVMLAKESKQKSRSNAFPSTKKDNRRIIHELAEHFGCESLSVDNEPSRMVIVTAVKDKCWIPSTSILTVIDREMGIRKGPAPITSSFSLGKISKYPSDGSKMKL